MNTSEPDGLSSLYQAVPPLQQQNAMVKQAHTPLREPLTKEEHFYLKNTLSKLNDSLHHLKAYVEVEEDSKGSFIVILPVDGSNSIDGWKDKVTMVRKEHFENMLKETILFPNKEAKADVQDLLYDLPVVVVERHKDSYVIVGSKEVVSRLCNKATEICSQHQITTIALQVSRKHVKFLCKFCCDEFEELGRREDIYDIQLNPDNETISVKASPNGHAKVKKVIEIIKITAEKKLKISHSAYKLLSSRQGAEKLNEIFGDMQSQIVYDFEQTQIPEGVEYNICFISKNAGFLKNIKKSVKKYMYEEKLMVSVAKIQVCSSKEWREFVSKLYDEQFVFVDTFEASSMIVITGEQLECNSAVEKVGKFLNEHTNIEKRVMVGQSEWFIINCHFLNELKGINDQAKKKHVKVNWPPSKSTESSLPVVICGELDVVDDIETMVNMLFKKVCKKASPIMGVPAVENVLDSLADKLRLLETDEKVKVEFILENADANETGSGIQVNKEVPQLLCAATSPSGSRVSVYTGDFAQNAPVGIIINFITSDPNTQVGFFGNLLESGGPEIVEDFQQKISQFVDLQPGVRFKTRYGQLKCSQLLHCVLFSWRDEAGIDEKEYFVEAALKDVVKAMTNWGSILVTPLTPAPLHYPVNVFVRLVMDAIIATDHNVQVTIYVEEPHHAKEFHSAFLSRNFQIHHNVQIESPSAIRTCKKTKPSVPATARTISSNLGNFITLLNGNLLEQQVCPYHVLVCTYIPVINM